VEHSLSVKSCQYSLQQSVLLTDRRQDERDDLDRRVRILKAVERRNAGRALGGSASSRMSSALRSASVVPKTNLDADRETGDHVGQNARPSPGKARALLVDPVPQVLVDAEPALEPL
jgi:hypothetical protein